jgi:signal peptidase I
MKNYSLKKSLSIFFHATKTLEQKQNSIGSEEKKNLEFRLLKLQEAINNRDKATASKEAKEIMPLLKKYFPLSSLKKSINGFAMICVALFFAIVIRQTCFEFYEIPTGSMRPTFKECDRLVVSKAQFGINVPLTAKHLSFSPEEVKRMGTIVFTAEGLDAPGIYTTYFYIFPGVKKFVKRMIGLPEDTLYFYGGRIYGIDKDGNDISPLLQQDRLAHLEHIPYLYINGRIKDIESVRSHTELSQVTIQQNHISIAKLEKSGKEIKGTMLQDGVDDVHQLWGMGNYGMTRIVAAEGIYHSKDAIDLLIKNPSTKYFLEITHHSSIKDTEMFYDFRGLKRPEASKRVSYLPLTTESLKTIWNNLYTMRFNTKKGYLEKFGTSYNDTYMLNDRTKIKGGLEDGTYEFFNGIAYKVKYQYDPFGMIPSLSIPEQVENSHVLAKFTENKCITLYNMGMDLSIRVDRSSHLGAANHRYAYYRDGDLYLMGAKILSKENDALLNFVAHEKDLLEQNPSYLPFVDAGAPLLADGTLDIAKIKQYGMQVPKKSYYTLGDNHAQSGDSREFGFVPEDNLRGVATFLLWAPGGRFGAPLQVPYVWFTKHKAFVWTSLLIAIAIYYVRERRKYAFLGKKTGIKKEVANEPMTVKRFLKIITIGDF